MRRFLGSMSMGTVRSDGVHGDSANPTHAEPFWLHFPFIFYCIARAYNSSHKNIADISLQQEYYHNHLRG
jgi:hypothetical protein